MIVVRYVVIFIIQTTVSFCNIAVLMRFLKIFPMQEFRMKFEDVLMQNIMFSEYHKGICF